MNNKIEQYIKTLVKLEKLKSFNSLIPFFSATIVVNIILSGIIASANNPMLASIVALLFLTLVMIFVHGYFAVKIKEAEEEKKKLDPTNRIKNWIQQTKEKILS